MPNAEIFRVWGAPYQGAGDGVQDDTAAITAAIDAAIAAGGGVVLFDKGTWRWTAGSKTIPSNIMLLGVPGATILLDTTLAGGSVRAPFEVYGDNVTFRGLKFQLNVANSAIGAYEYSNLLVEDCYFTGTGTGFGYITVRADSTNTRTGMSVRNNTFKDCTGNECYPINLNIPTGATRTIVDTEVTGNRFKNCNGAMLKFTVVDGTCRDTRFVNNYVEDPIRLTGNYSFAVWGGLDATYKIENVKVNGNHYYSTRNEPKVFAALYSLRDFEVKDNIAYDGGTDTDTIFFAPGRLGNPIEHGECAGNVVDGWGTWLDADSMRYVDIHDNTVKNVGPNAALHAGYQTQEYVRHHHNLFYNSAWATAAAAISVGDVTSLKKCEITDNVIIDDRGTPVINKFVYTSGGGTDSWDSSDLRIERNRVHVPSGTVTEGVTKNVSTTVAPTVVGPNEIHDSAGRRPSGAVPSIASAATITIPPQVPSGGLVEVTGSTTVTSITASWAQRRVTIKWAAAATFDVTDGSNLKLAGSVTTLDADDTITLVCDGTNWYECGRSVN